MSAIPLPPHLAPGIAPPAPPRAQPARAVPVSDLSSDLAAPVQFQLAAPAAFAGVPAPRLAPTSSVRGLPAHPACWMMVCVKNLAHPAILASWAAAVPQ